MKPRFLSFFNRKKQKHQTHDEIIGYLANELIKELKASGRSIELSDIDEGYGSFDITVQNLGSKNEYVSIGNIINDWEIKVKPTFKEF